MSESTWAPTPASAPLGEILKDVAGYVLMPLDDEVLDVARQGVKAAIAKLNTRTWNWALTYSTVTFAAGTQEYDLDQSFKQPRNFSLRDTNGLDRDRLNFLPWGSFLKDCQWGVTGSPEYYSVTNPQIFGVLRLDMSPSAAWVAQNPTGRLWYYRRIQLPTDTGALNVPHEVGDYVREYAQGFAADRYAVDKAREAYDRAKEMFNVGPGPSGALVRDDCHGQQTDWEY
jgi:hypothetical protein